MSRALASLDLAPIAGLLARIEEAYQPREVWLFGSRASDRAVPESDWDLLVVTDAPANDVDPRHPWRLARASGVRADVILCDSGTFRESREVPNTLAYEVFHTGICIRER